jgi:hypothetical protein
MNNTGFGCRIAVLILHEETFTIRKYSIYGRLHGLSIYMNIAGFFVIGMYRCILTQPVLTLGIIPKMKLRPIKMLVK